MLPPVAYWIVKSEPSKYSYDQLERDGSAVWDGVRNFAARNNLRAMKKGDGLLFYHSQEGKEVVGMARVTRAAYQDPGTEEDWSAVDVAPAGRLKRPVGLAAMKAEPRLKDLGLLSRPRLSVVPVSRAEFELIVRIGGGTG